MKALIIFALVNIFLVLAYFLLYLWYSMRRALDRFRSAFK